MMGEIIEEAWIALRRNRSRSLLTMLGIVWGIVAVTLLIAYGSGFRHVLVAAFDAFGSSTVIAWPAQTSEQPGGQRAGKQVKFEHDDLEAVRQEATMVRHVMPGDREVAADFLRRSHGQHRDSRGVSGVRRDAQRTRR